MVGDSFRAGQLLRPVNGLLALEMADRPLGVRQNSSWLALILTFSPWRRDSHWQSWVDGWSSGQCRRGFSVRRRTILPLLEERAGVRSSFSTGSALHSPHPNASCRGSCLQDRAGEGGCVCEADILNPLILPIRRLSRKNFVPHFRPLFRSGLNCAANRLVMSAGQFSSAVEQRFCN